MHSENSFSLKRRQVIQMSGISAAGAVAFSQAGLAQESDANVFVSFSDQESDGQSIVIDSLETDVEAELLIFESEGDRSMYKRMDLDTGTEFTNRRVELDNPIPETQLISISVQPPEGSSSYGGARATVTIGETTPESGFGTEPGTQRIDANPEAGFHSPYFLYTPETPDSATESVNDSQTRPLLVQIMPWGDFEERVESARDAIQGGVMRADVMNCPALVAPLPNGPESGFRSPEEPQDIDPRHERVDLQLLAMIEDAKSRLNGGTFTVADQFHFAGGSSSGYFIDAFAALHPEHVEVFSSGANGFAFLPLEKLTEDIPTHGDPDHETTPWPIGAGNLDERIGEEFNRKAWMKIDQFRWIGAEDQDPENPDEYIHKAFRGSDEIDELIEDIFGTLQVDHRFETSRKIYDHLGVPATFTVFEGVGHVPDGEHFGQIFDHHQEKIVENYEVVHLVPQTPADEVRVGEAVTVTVTAENATAVASTTTAALAVNGTEVDSTEIQVDADSTDIIELDATLEETGEFTLSVNGAAVGDPIVVTGERTETSTEDSTTNETRSSESSNAEPEETSTEEAPGFGIIHSIAALGGIIYLVKRRFSRGE